MINFIKKLFKRDPFSISVEETDRAITGREVFDEDFDLPKRATVTSLEELLPVMASTKFREFEDDDEAIKLIEASGYREVKGGAFVIPQELCDLHDAVEYLFHEWDYGFIRPEEVEDFEKNS